MKKAKHFRKDYKKKQSENEYEKVKELTKQLESLSSFSEKIKNTLAEMKKDMELIHQQTEDAATDVDNANSRQLLDDEAQLKGLYDTLSRTSSIIQCNLVEIEALMSIADIPNRIENDVESYIDKPEKNEDVCPVESEESVNSRSVENVETVETASYFENLLNDVDTYQDHCYDNSVKLIVLSDYYPPTIDSIMLAKEIKSFLSLFENFDYKKNLKKDAKMITDMYEKADILGPTISEYFEKNNILLDSDYDYDYEYLKKMLYENVPDGTSVPDNFANADEAIALLENSSEKINSDTHIADDSKNSDNSDDDSSAN